MRKGRSNSKQTFCVIKTRWYWHLLLPLRQTILHSDFNIYFLVLDKNIGLRLICIGRQGYPVPWPCGPTRRLSAQPITVFESNQGRPIGLTGQSMYRRTKWPRLNNLRTCEHTIKQLIDSSDKLQDRQAAQNSWCLTNRSGELRRIGGDKPIGLLSCATQLVADQ
jgi:hypothetical protein